MWKWLKMPLRGYNPDTALAETLSELRALIRDQRQVIDAPENVKGLIMALQADVQALVDKVAANTSATQSMKQSFDLQSKQIQDQQNSIDGLKSQISDLQSKQGSNQPIDAEDLAAIQDSVGKIDATNRSLAEVTSAVSTAAPANVQDTSAPAEAPTTSSANQLGASPPVTSGADGVESPGPSEAGTSSGTTNPAGT